MSDPAALLIESLSHRAGDARTSGRMILDRINLTVAAGEIVALIGQAGSGKSTLLRLIAGLEPVQTGRITITGRVVAGGDIDLPRDARGLGAVLPHDVPAPGHSLRDAIAGGLGALGMRERRERVQTMLELAGLESAGLRPWQSLSGGERQRAAWARALAGRPRLLLLDDGFAGLDPIWRRNLRALLRDRIRAGGMAVLMTMRDANEIALASDRMVVLQAGRVLQTGKPEELRQSPAAAGVLACFGPINRLPGRIEAGIVRSLLGERPAPPGMRDGEEVELVIRPEALTLSFEVGPDKPTARVEAVEWTASGSRVELTMATCAGAPRQPLIAALREPFSALPGVLVSVRVDPAQIFVFSRESPTS
jgi:ABC-type sulfate/molybdate transport systems ATPase subunit